MRQAVFWDRRAGAPEFTSRGFPESWGYMVHMVNTWLYMVIYYHYMVKVWLMMVNIWLIVIDNG